MSSKTLICREKLSNAYGRVPYGSTWRHYKGGIYNVLDHSISTIDGEVSVIYQRIDGPDYNVGLERDIKFARPLSEWLDPIDNEDQNTRFVRVHKSTIWKPVNE